MLALTATSTTQAHRLPKHPETFPSHLLQRIHHQRDMTHKFQRLIGKSETPYRFWAERRCGNKNCRYQILRKWHHRHHYWKHLYEHIGTAVTTGGNSTAVPAGIHSFFECINIYEEGGRWSTPAGGLGFIYPPSAYNVGITDQLAAQYGDSWYTMPKEAQILFGYQLYKAYGTSPWSTAYHCS